MIGLTIKRLLQGITVLLLLSVIIFVFFSVLGGETLSVQENNPQISPEIIKQWRSLYGLDQSLPDRYINWLSNLIQGNLGQSIHYNRPVIDLVWQGLKRTIPMAFLALIIAGFIAMTLGVAAARYSGSWIDSLSNVIVLFGSSTPRLIVSLVTLSFVARTTWYDFTDISAYGTFSEWVMRITPPAFALSWPLAALFLSQVREGIGEALNRDYVRTARAKGVSEFRIMYTHVLRPALSPMITVFGYALGSIMSGSVIVEKVLNWPGIGEISLKAVKYRDIPLLMVIIIISVTIIILGNLLSDIMLCLNDPRVRDSRLSNNRSNMEEH